MVQAAPGFLGPNLMSTLYDRILDGYAVDKTVAALPGQFYLDSRTLKRASSRSRDNTRESENYPAALLIEHKFPEGPNIN